MSSFHLKECFVGVCGLLWPKSSIRHINTFMKHVMHWSSLSVCMSTSLFHSVCCFWISKASLSLLFYCFLRDSCLKPVFSCYSTSSLEICLKLLLLGPVENDTPYQHILFLPTLVVTWHHVQIKKIRYLLILNIYI